MDATFLKDKPFFPVSPLQGETTSEEANTSTYSVPRDLFLKPIPETNDSEVVQESEPKLAQGASILDDNECVEGDVVNSNEVRIDSGSELSGTRSCTKHSMKSFLSYSNLSSRFKAFPTNLDTVVIPGDVYKAMEVPEWRATIMKEMCALETNRTWDLVAPLKGHKTVGCKWVFTVKYKFNRTLNRYKARSTPGKVVVLIVYVDDIILSGDDSAEFGGLK
ncbi:uncharacterized protein LOC120071197 [Benincasa hispida]|uniref:uncharacterized protein LOC120071197 n=1 Tax=Benincasa hispida TaxID=102211 RepID=UPI0019020B35|nr:uncharacterized protein LOC120071197 [Benincasa hispida]